MIRLEVGLRVLMKDLPSLEDGAISALQRVRENDLGTEGVEDPFALYGGR